MAGASNRSSCRHPCYRMLGTQFISVIYVTDVANYSMVVSLSERRWRFTCMYCILSLQRNLVLILTMIVWSNNCTSDCLLDRCYEDVVLFHVRSELMNRVRYSVAGELKDCKLWSFTSPTQSSTSWLWRWQRDVMVKKMSSGMSRYVGCSMKLWNFDSKVYVFDGTSFCRPFIVLR